MTHLDPDDDDNYEDEYDVASFVAHISIVTLDHSDRFNSIKDAFVGKTKLYIDRCSTVAGREPHSAAYLSTISNFRPVRQVMIGQSPYSEDILPKYGAAFAFDEIRAGFWTPTSQVLAQCMNKYADVPIRTALEYICHSYCLASRGIVLVNVYPYQNLNDQHVVLLRRVCIRGDSSFSAHGVRRYK